jgi:hypothetical protein
MYNEFVRVSNAWEEATSDSVTAAGLSEPGSRGDQVPLQFLKDPLTLSQPGEQNMLTTLLLAPPAPRIFRPSYGPVQYAVEEEPRSRKRSDG